VALVAAEHGTELGEGPRGASPRGEKVRERATVQCAVALVAAEHGTELGEGPRGASPRGEGVCLRPPRKSALPQTP
jgi:hypothetical protein